MLLAFFSASTTMYISWLVEDKTECVEKKAEKEKEGEQEEQEKKEKESFEDGKKVVRQLAIQPFATNHLAFCSYYFCNHCLEVPTPPPRLA